MLDLALQYQSLEVDTLKGIGDKSAQVFKNFGLKSYFDLFIHLPFRYEDKTKITPIAELKNGQPALVVGKIMSTQVRPKVYNVSISDNSLRSLNLAFFNYWPNTTQQLTFGKFVQAYGNVRVYEFQGIRTYSIAQPEYTIIKDLNDYKTEEYLTPVYHLTAKLTQKKLRKVIDSALEILKKQAITELIPQKLNPFSYTLNDALLTIHHPKPCDLINGNPESHKAFSRICFEELTAYQISLLSLKNRNAKKTALEIKPHLDLQDEFIKTLPFTPTNAQLRVFNEILEDLKQSSPMSRLVQGDVGSGKTLVALMAALQVTANLGQCSIMAPTELLAKQHYTTAYNLLSQLGIKVVYLAGKMTAKARRETLAHIASGQAQIVVGTHALVGDEVIFKNLSLCIIDEQHRFGLDQRAKLLQKAQDGTSPHQLAMTATPIPRTLQLALYSDLDVSIINELPKGRIPIKTAVIDDSRLNEVIAHVKQSCEQGVQVYWVCPRIEESEEDESASVKKRFKQLTEALPDLSIGLLHGQLNSKQKNEVMQDFIDKKYSILVSTTVIEVGVDVPNASIMIIEGSHRLGLAQLHQLRGRVGRGDKASFCLLLYTNAECTEIAEKRLQTMRNTTDGFKIATEDLILRGPGDIIGDKQTGFDIFKVADVGRDFPLIKEARTCALELIEHHQDIAKSLIQRWFPQYL